MNVIETEHEFTQQEIQEKINRWENKCSERTEEIKWLWKHRHDKTNRLVRLQRMRFLIRGLRRVREDLHYWRSLAD